MIGVGRPPSSSPGERAEVFWLADAGLSHRQIAERVFGDRRYHLRVLRLLRRRDEYDLTVTPEGERALAELVAEFGDPRRSS